MHGYHLKNILDYFNLVHVTQKFMISEILRSEEEYDDDDDADDADDDDGKLSFLDPLSRLIIYYKASFTQGILKMIKFKHLVD